MTMFVTVTGLLGHEVAVEVTQQGVIRLTIRETAQRPAWDSMPYGRADHRAMSADLSKSGAEEVYQALFTATLADRTG